MTGLIQLSYRDYAANQVLDQYSDAGIDDEGEHDELSGAARRAAEAQMTRRDRLERAGGRGRRAATRSHAPAFLGSDDDMDNEDLDELGISSMRRRTRKQYDERRDMDDLEGVEDVSPLSFASFTRYPTQKYCRSSRWNN